MQSTANTGQRADERAVWAPAPVPAAAGALAAAGHPALLAALLARRGVGDAFAAERFLQPSTEELHDPFLLAGVEPAVELLLDAARRQATVAIVGDYDVDGVTATALLTAVFRVHGLVVLPILPHRMRDGYGFKAAHAEQARAGGASVLVTVDCGTTAIPAIDAALALGLEVIVTDHHLPGPAFPERAHLINPQRGDCRYPFGGLAGVGLALKLAQALGQRSARRLPLLPLLRVAALGTIADVVPLVGENRVIATLGLRALSDTPSPGLRALLRNAGVTAPLTSDDVGFRLAPRLNAAGRLDSARAALDLLLSRDVAEVEALAEQLETLNGERQTEERRVTEEARAAFALRDPLPGVLLAFDPSWHRGVVGIAAGRLAREFNRPTILLAVDGDVATGSGRSIEGIPLHPFLQPFAGRLEAFGGHEAAIGMTVRTSELAALRADLEAAARWPAELLRRRYEYELDVTPARVDRELYSWLLALEPHGAGNPRPLLRIGPLRLRTAPQLFGEERHLRARAAGDDGSLALTGFGFGGRRDELAGAFDALGSLAWDPFLGEPSLHLVDVRPAG